ncbi:MAG TPA: hypothetical protein VLT87_20895 [Thermoanaerobaculia bacterium]|nr:hypothetical protein [Thermoanaerobaculia bacterium]
MLGAPASLPATNFSTFSLDDDILSRLPEPEIPGWESMMKGYKYQSDFAKKYYAQGFEEGLAEAREEGRIEQVGRSLLIVFRARGIAVPDGARERILAEKDPERLRLWLEKAAVATSVAAVLDEPN